MDKDKPIDRKDNNLENKIEDYKDSSGNPEAFIEDMTDPEATAIFKEAFYAEGKALEEEALRSPFMEDEEKKEALRLRILAAAGRSTAENTVLEHKVASENRIEDTEADETVKKKKKRKFTPFMRWAAVLALVCLGVFGVSVTGQAKGNGLWSSIQRLVGGETRWQQDNNGEDRTYSNPEEEKAIREIEEKLDIDFPIFFYWPGEIVFKDAIIYEESQKFLLEYVDGERIIYFEGGKGDAATSSNNVWQGQGKTEEITNNEINYLITEAESDVYDNFYYVKWTMKEESFAISGLTDKEEVIKIIKNIKN